MQIDGKFVSLMCLALLRKLDRGTTKYQMAEVRYLIYVLLRELMMTPLVGFDAKANKKKKGIKNDVKMSVVMNKNLDNKDGLFVS